MKKLSYEYVKNQFVKEGYKLLSKNYTNNNTKLKIECTKGHQYNVTYNNFRNGKRCPFCYGNKKHTYEYIKNQIEKTGYKLLSNKYKNAFAKLKIQCSEGHQYNVKYNNLQQGQKCAACAGNKKHTYDNIKNQIEKEDYKLLSKEYKDALSKLKIQCPEGHQYNVTYGNFSQGKRCPFCWDMENHSRSEKDCLNVVKQLTNENVIENNRTQIVNPRTNKFLELDIWIPSLKKAIEFNGEYWHSSVNKKLNDKQKVKQCKEKNIDLLIIWYQDWIDNREKQIEKIKRLFGGFFADSEMNINGCS